MSGDRVLITSASVSPAMSIATARRTLAARFAEAGLPTPDLDARLIVGHALGLTLRDFLLAPEEPLGSAAAGVAHAAERRLSREPVARILGDWEFWGLTFELGRATLVPRPDTETIVAVALDRLEEAGLREAPLRLLDLGTGSGAILVALLSELPQAFGVGVDLAPEAIALARANARRNGVADRAAFFVGHWSSALGASFDVVAANPPYICRDALADLEPEVRVHDPALALDGGPDGLSAYRGILAGLDGVLNPGGFAIFEIGAGAAAEVASLLGSAGFVPCRIERDLAGLERAVVVPGRDIRQGLRPGLAGNEKTLGLGCKSD